MSTQFGSSKYSKPAFGPSSAGFNYRKSGQDITVDELLLIAKAQGGNIAEVAEELSNPRRSMLSTTGQKFKNAFKGFIDVISTPSHIVAGLIDKDVTVKDAMKQNLSISDAIFGNENIFDKDGDPSTLSKIGNFIVRMPFDILLDPTTYLTFGASAGVTGIKSLGKVSLGQKAAKEFGEKAGAKAASEGFVTKSLTKKGKNVEDYVRAYERQMRGTYGIMDKETFGKSIASRKKDLIASGVSKNVLDQSEDIVKAMVKDTVEKPLDIDFAKKSMTKLFENNPALVQEYIDKGGIKYFGKTILSSQRIDSVKKMIPGMRYVDNATLPIRNKVASFFDTGLQKMGDGSYARIPEEYRNTVTKLKTLGESINVDFVRNLSNVQKALNLSQPEIDLVTAALTTKKVPADARLAKAYYTFMGIDEQQLNILRSTGKQVHNLDGHTSLVFVPTSTKDIRINSGLAKELGAAQEAQNAKFIPISDKPISETSQEFNTILSEYTIPDDLKNKINKSKSVDEIGRIIGEEVDKIAKKSDNVESGLETTKTLRELRDKVDALPKAKPLIGRTDKLGITEIDKEKYAELGIEESEGRYFIDNENKIFKRVGTTAQELKDAGFDGFDTNLFTAVTTRAMQNHQQALGQHFAEGLVRNFGKLKSEAPESWVTLSSAITDEKAKQIYGNIFERNGDELVFHPAIAKNYADMIKASAGDEITDDFLRLYDKTLSYWKSSVTTIFPMFHGRNAISGVFMNMLDLGFEGYNPKTYTMSASIIADDRKLNSIMEKIAKGGDNIEELTKQQTELLNKKVFTDSAGYNWTFGELRSVAKDNGIAFNPNLTGPIDRGNMQEGLADFFDLGQTSKRKKKLQKINPLNEDKFIPFKFGRDVGTTIEEHARMTNFMANLRKTGDVAHAATRTKQFLFDYGSLTPFEKNVMRRLVPFYTFTRKNLELQAKTIMSSPGRISNQITLVKSIGDALGGEELTEEEQALMPPWLKNSINLKRTKKDGSTQIITGFGTPIEQPFQQFGGTQVEGSLSPIIKIPLEKLTGYDFFRGKPISSVTNAENYELAPQAVKDFIGYAKYEGVTQDGRKYVVHTALRPDRMHSINNLPAVGRTLSTINQITDSDVEGGLRALQSVTGIRTDDIDFERQAQLQEEELKKAIEKVLKDSGIRGEFTRGYTRTNTTLIEN